MKIIFHKAYIDKETFDTWLIIEVGDTAFLVDEVTGRVEIANGFDKTYTIESVPASCYDKVRTDVINV